MKQEVRISINLTISADATLSKDEIDLSIRDLLYGSIPDCSHTGNHRDREMTVEKIEYCHIQEESEIYKTEG